MSAPGPVLRAGEMSRTDWQTPREVFDALNEEFRFTLDAAASDHNHLCERYLTEAEDGLRSDWLDNVVFLNPPYGKGLEDWVKKCANASEMGATVVALLPSAVDTKWFRFAYATASEVRIVVGRVPFVRLDGKPSANTGGSLIVIWRAGWRHWDTRQGPPKVRLWDWR